MAELQAEWICGFFLKQGSTTSTGSSGSCIVPTIRLGKVGVLDPAKNGNFTIAIPDFAIDPLDGRRFAPGQDYGWIALTLCDHITGRPLASVVPVGGSKPGLKIEDEYADPLRFYVATTK
jgi:hypothetical protein